MVTGFELSLFVCCVLCDAGSCLARYHPHFHGLVDSAMLGGASGLIVVQGLEQVADQARGPIFLVSPDRLQMGGAHVVQT